MAPMKKLLVSFSILSLAACASEAPMPKTDFPTMGFIERKDPALDALIPKDAKIEVLAKGFLWSEGPLWIKEGGFVIFSDIPNNAIMKWAPGAGLDLYLKPAGYTGAAPRGGESGSNGLILDPQGRLVLCQHGNRQMARMDAPLLTPKANFATVADRYDGKRLNSPNDACYHSGGALYFTDPPYGLEKNVDDPAKELPYQGVYRLSKEGKLTLLTDQLTRPNGIAFSPDEKKLYVAVSDPKNPIWMVYDVQADGSIADGKVFFDSKHLADQGLKGLPDGLKLDRSGNLFATGPGGVLILSPEGKHLGTINTGQATANCAWGEDGTVLYITAHMYLARVKTSTRGNRY